MSDLDDTLRRLRARVERALDARLPLSTPPVERLHAAMRYAVLNGGKRLRACLVYAAGEALGAESSELDDPACAVELMHAYSLVHDDLPAMDDDDLRRGQPSCHKAFDEAIAILTGDALQSLAFEVLATGADLRRLAMIATLARASGAHGMAGGQALDLASVGATPAASALEDCYARKTGALIHAAVRLGALARPDAPAALARALDDYGHAIGLAFQIVDDLLDVVGSTATLGKTAGADSARSKPNYAAMLGIDAARARAEGLAARALESLGPLGDNARILADLARFTIHRAQ